MHLAPRTGNVYNELNEVFMENNPIFKFAIREDLKDTGTLFLPTRATARSTGWDVRAAVPDRKPLIVEAGQMVKIPLGFRTFCPEGWWFELKPRSSTFAKKHLHCLYGTVDEDYRGELILAAQYMPNYIGHRLSTIEHTSLTIEFGEALGQIIPVKLKEMKVEQISNEEYDSLCKNCNAERGVGGFGSTTTGINTGK